MINVPRIVVLSVVLAVAGASQIHKPLRQPASDQADTAQSPAPSPAEDISGMYSFLKDGEFLQINVERDAVSGYISRWGTLESDKGAFLDQFFSKATIQGHDLSFTTKPVHGVWYEFRGRYDRGQAKTKSEDGFYVLRGTLTEFLTDSEKKTTSRSREVQFQLLAQPQEDDGQDQKKPKKKS
jgi:hypothetical protein